MTAPSTPHQHASARRPADPARRPDRRVRVRPAVPAAHRARGRVLRARRRRDVPQHGPPAPVDARRAARRAQDQRRAGRGPRPGPRATSTAAWRSCARTATTTTSSARSTRSSTSARCSTSGRRSWRSSSCSTPRCRAGPSTSGSSPASSTGSRATPCSWAGWRSTSVASRRSCTRFIERDEIVEMLAAVTGQRMLFNYFRIGGVNGDLNHEFMSRLGDWMSRAAAQHEANTQLLNENEIFVRRMRGMGHLDRDTALRMAVTGPQPPGRGRPVRHPPGAPVLGLPRARVQHPGPRRRPEGRRRARPLPAARRRGQREPADHRPVPPQHARRADHGQAAAPAAPAPGSRVGRGRGRRAACTAPTRSPTGRTSRSG